MKPGFQQTEAGVIPVDWQVKSIRELGQLSKGKGIRKNEADSGTIPCIRYGELYTHHNNVIRFYNSYISEQVARTSRRLSKGDVLFAGSGETKEEIGKCAAFVGDEIAYAGGDILVLTPNQGDPRYFGYLFNAPTIARQKAGKGQGDAIVHITAPALASVRVPLPPTLAEQEAIAEALGDADALIESLERLVAKKRDVKQGAMQELLTGRRRLPGFTGKWEETSLGTLGKTYGGLTGKTKADFGAGTSHYIPFLNILNNVYIDLKQLDRVRLRQGEVQNSACKTDLFFNGSSETPEEVGLCSALLQDVGDLYLNSFCFGFRFNRGDEADSLYLAYFFRGGAGRKLLYALAQGATRHNLSKVALLAVKFRLPSISEQKAIAAVLSDMDAELAALEAKLSKARAIKQGMMQELLTGRIRLK